MPPRNRKKSPSPTHLDSQAQDSTVRSLHATASTHATFRYYSLIICIVLLSTSIQLPHGIIAVYILATKPSNTRMYAIIALGVCNGLWSSIYGDVTVNAILAAIVAIRVLIVERIENDQKTEIDEMENLKYEFQTV